MFFFHIGAPIKADVKFGGPLHIKLKIPIIISTNEHPRTHLNQENLAELYNRAIVKKYLINVFLFKIKLIITK